MNDETAKLLLDAKNQWMDRALKAERDNVLLRQALAEIADAGEYAPGLAEYAGAALARIPA